MDLAKTKIEDAKTSGADVVLAPCPFCVLNLKQAGGMDVMDLIEFVSFRF
jgi:Fe-S oxidoreductase